MTLLAVRSWFLPGQLDADALRYTYSGVSSRTQVAKVRTGSDVDSVTLSDAATTETYDGQGRLASVTEPAQSVGGTRVSTQYTYDAGGRLADVCSNAVNLSCGQTRTFRYYPGDGGSSRTTLPVGSAGARETMVETFLMHIDDPVILLDADDILFFRDISTLMRYAEPIDVAAGSFRVFDADGRPIIFSTYRHPTTFLGIPIGETFTPITAEVQSSDAESEILRHVLLKYLKTRTRDAEEFEALRLVQRAIGIAGYSV
ncbi:MAG TPA: RHS repeat domain-containing protein [Thermoanaerobaculia bacterium]|jgi:YD repeat-containing protein